MSVATNQSSKLGTPFTLPCGLTVPNRIAKAAMSEQLADPRVNVANAGHFRLYERWSQGGIGLSLTGNVIVDRRFLESARNVACEPGVDTAADFKEYARAVKGRDGSCVAIVQLGHAGRQTSPTVPNAELLSASDVQLLVDGRATPLFRRPRAMTLDEIHDVTRRFAHAAAVMQAAGFDGVELHAAHGYLISQFLSPLSNRRDDAYGGSPQNRRQLLLEVLRAVRAATGPRFVVGVKLNSADFQRGGFSEEESLEVVSAMAAEPGLVDFVEVSGGSYESAAMMDGAGVTEERRAVVKQREAFFLDFA
eukprot:CAMPEP_0113671214 /NCGR_PEP_ID=MMETSP0038_2-20120614/5580_1 /TAXON_ID=2898 /ORGANISM="Cryptomonas paramecium" /LENGTH=306 /DNA_ID=CAMNT_0000587341 /DNA_START=216 /DNA_END=1132 /DNA_ORIENTATION=+ /assembly_acc=CAM_ASM_000170